MDDYKDACGKLRVACRPVAVCSYTDKTHLRGLKNLMYVI
jgi:hypothetical protein